MRKIKATLGSTCVAMALCASMIMTDMTAYAQTVQQNAKDFSSNAYAVGNLILTDEERQKLDEEGKVLRSIDDLQRVYGKNNLKVTREPKGRADNSNNKYFPAIGNQGSVGSCASWAMTYLQATYTLNKARNLDSSDTANVFSPMWTYNMTNQGAHNGTTLVDVCYVLTEIGAVSIEDVPMYNTTINSNQYGDLHAKKDLWLQAQKNQIGDAYIVDIRNDLEDTPITNPKDKDLDLIKALLDNGEVLSCSTPASKWRTTQIVENDEVPENSKFVGQDIISRCDGYEYGGHRIAIVGYNDNIWVDVNQNGIVEQGEKGAFKIANSWGTEYGNDGFVWFSYDSVNQVSSVKQGSAINLGRYRDCSLIDIVAMTPKEVDEPSNCYAEFTINSAAASSIKIDITAMDENGASFTYGVAPFKSSNMYYSVGAVSLDGTRKAADGTFVIDLDNVVKDITPDTINDYTWNINFTDSTRDSKSLIIKDVKLLDTKNNKEYDSSLEEDETINGTYTRIYIK
ncbi:MAG: hypothetical protein E7262_10155 [Lachnospiraceae bacterium]|nr:hypothetical protein [Lachnospiraceae bacterium]